MLHPVSAFQLRVSILQEYDLLVLREQHKSTDQIEKTYGESFQLVQSCRHFYNSYKISPH